MSTYTDTHTYTHTRTHTYTHAYIRMLRCLEMEKGHEVSMCQNNHSMKISFRLLKKKTI